MARAGTVTIDLDASSVKLLRELKKSQRATETTAKKMRTSMTRAFSAIRASVLSAVTVMGVFAAFRGFGRVAGEIDQIGKLVDRLGGSTEAFSELQFVAERSGLAFNTLTMGLQRMQRRVAEAAVDMGEARGALKELGLNAKALSNLSIDRQFEVIAEALTGVTKESDKTRLAMKLFDSEGVALLQTMNNGARGIQELREEARRLGISLSREQVDAATAAKDAMTSLNASAGALGITLTTKLAPSITRVTDGLNNMFTGNRQAEIARRMDEIRGQIKTLSGFSGASAKKTVSELTDEFGRLAKELETLKNPSRETIENLEEISEIIVTVAKKTDIYAEDLSAFSKKFQTAEERADALRRSLKRFDSDLDPSQIAMIRDEISEILTSGIEEINTGPILRMKRHTKAATKEMSEYAKEAARNMQDAFADFLFDPFEDGLKGMLKGFLDVMRRMLANQLAASLFQTGPLSNLFGGGRAMGGSVMAGVPYLVGEKGPEIVVPGQSGSVIPNHKLGGGTNVTYNISAPGIDEASVMTRLVPVLEQTVETTKSEIRRDMQEGRFT